MIDVDRLLRDARSRLPPGEAELLVGHVLGRSGAWLLAHGDAGVDAAQVARVDALVARRQAGEPVAYLTGRRGFWTLELAVGPDVLVPRPETELLVELALQRLPAEAPLRLLDLGTGSGAIALALASERPRTQVLAVDASAAALMVARGNAQRLGIGNVAFAQGDWYAPVAGQRFDLIAANPPYVAQGDPHLQQGDLRFEPPLALASGADGLDAIRTIAAGAPAHLRPGGWLLVEHGWQQGAAVRALLAEAGLDEVSTATDLEGRERVSLGRSG